MLENDALKKYLEEARGIRYADIKRFSKNCVKVTLTNNVFEVTEVEDRIIGCRAVDRGYGVTSTNRSVGTVDTLLQQAIDNASRMDGCTKLREVNPERGSYEHPVKSEPSVEDLRNLAVYARDSLCDKIHSLNSIEIVLSYTESETGLVTSEGTDVEEKGGMTDLEIKLTIKTPSGASEVRRVAGGKGGMETIQHREFEDLVGDLLIVAKGCAGSKRFSPLESGKKFRVILDSEAAAALARLIANMLGAHEFTGVTFDSLTIPKELEIVDNPLIPRAYGSFVWDDEGVRGSKKILVGNGTVNLLHTRLTAGEDDIPGNAHGISHMPRPSMSNVYIGNSDWRFDEMVNDTKDGLLMKGARRAELNSSSGIIELEPVVAYIIERKEIKQAITNVKLIDTVKNILQRIDAIGKLISLIPNREEGFNTSAGAPYIRIDGARCTYSVMQ
jgi:TldD protein